MRTALGLWRPAAALLVAFALTAPTTADAQEFPTSYEVPTNALCVNWIKFAKNPSKLDRMKLRGGITPLSFDGIDPPNELVRITLSNANGTIFDEIIPVGGFVQRNSGRLSFFYRNPDARQTGAISTIRINERPRKGGFLFEAFVWDDLSAATLANMTLRIQIGNDIFTDTEDWKTHPSGWRRTRPNFP